jgi:hypothetical protein
VIKNQIEAIVKQQLLTKDVDTTQNSMFKDVSRMDKSKMNMTDTRFLQQATMQLENTSLQEDDLAKSFKSHRSGKSGKTIFTSRNRAGSHPKVVNPSAMAPVGMGEKPTRVSLASKAAKLLEKAVPT